MAKPKQKPTRKAAPKKSPVNIWLNRLFIAVLIGALLAPAAYNWYQARREDRVPLSQLVDDVRQERVKKLVVAGNELTITYQDDTQKKSEKEGYQDLVSIFDEADIDPTATEIVVENLTIERVLMQVLGWVAYLGMFVLLLYFMSNRLRGDQENIMGFGRSKAKIFVKGKQDVKFEDVGGMHEAKQELEEIVDFLKNPKKYQKVGARTPKGVLLVGPAGTGKTLLARAVAGEANVQFLSIAGSEFMEMLVGVGASRVRDLFSTAKKLSPSIIFIDEIDAIGRMRGHGSMGGHDEREQTLNQILVEMDGFSQNDNIVVIAATNRGDLLDTALVRPGRFDRRVMVTLPDLEERKFILKIHAEGKPFASTVNWDRVAKRTVGFSGADLENMLNEAAIAIARQQQEQITMADIEEASLKVKLGPSKKRLQDDYERKMTAYHEAGHALIAHLSPYADPVHRISIVSRGQALGFTLTPPEKDKVQSTKSEMIDEIAVLLGGRAAEEVVFNELTAGASSDIERATQIARAMVVDFGMSKLGPINFGPQHETRNYTRAMYEPARISDRLQEQVDAEIMNFINQGAKQAISMMKKHRKQLDAVSEALLEKETLDTDDFEKIMGVPKVKSSNA